LGLAQLNTRVPEPMKTDVKAVCEAAGIDMEVVVADVLRFYFNMTDALTEGRRSLVLAAAQPIIKPGGWKAPAR
jgi:hypothetical protein